MSKTVLAASAIAIGLSFGSLAFAQNGPVAAACKEDIAHLCAGKQHVQGDVRACLEANKDNVSQQCKAALESTPGGSQGHMR